MNDNTQIRKELVAHCSRVVIKAGTRLLSDLAAVETLISQIKRIRDAGIQVILVSSGAVGTGMKCLGIEKRPRRLSEVQALAAIGQIHLIAMYDAECRKFGFSAAQILLTADDLRSRERHLNTLNCIEPLLAKNVLPIRNENDPVSVAELKFGDNDTVAALVASMMRADLAVILTTVDGLKKPNPDGTLGETISVVRGITESERSMATGSDNGNLSIGGMASKLKCADIMNQGGDALWVADGRDPLVLDKIFKGQDVGTVFLPVSREKLDSRKRWLASFAKSAGKIVIDDGAVRAVLQRGSSLLPSGVTAVEGSFKRGSVVEIRSGSGALVAKGLSNFSAAQCRLIAGKQTSEIHTILKSDADSEIVHRNNMAVHK